MKASTLSSAALAAATLAALGWLAVENHRLERELARTQAGLKSVSVQLQTARFRADSNSLQERAAAGPAPGEARAARVRLWDDPVWRARQFDEAYLRVEARYGRFFQKLAGWSPDRLEALKRQLANNDLALMRAAMLADDSDGKFAGDAVRNAEAGNQQQLRELLGETGYAWFDASQKAEPYRESVGSIVDAMRAKSSPLSEDKQESVLGAYAAAMQEAAAQAAPVDPRQLTQDQLAALKRQQTEAFRARLMDKLSGVLDEAQLQVFMETEIEQEGGG